MLLLGNIFKESRNFEIKVIFLRIATYPCLRKI